MVLGIFKLNTFYINIVKNQFVAPVVPGIFKPNIFYINIIVKNQVVARGACGTWNF